MVSRTLARHRLDICAAAKALGVNRTDLRKLTWHDPKLLEEGLDACFSYRSDCFGLMLDDLSSPRRWKRARAAEQILASPFAYGHPMALAMAPARRPKPKSNKPWSPFVVEMNRRRALKKAALSAAQADAATEAISESVSAAEPQ